jgi:shikimate dehydrogenase
MGPLGVASRAGGRFRGAVHLPHAGREAARAIPARTLVDCYRRQIGRDTRVFGLVGSDVLRSLSPAIHNRAFSERGVDAVYVPLQAESLPGLIDAIPALGVSGFGVTRPYKSEIVKYLDSVTPHAAEAGSVNTVLVQDGRLVGLSTDATACCSCCGGGSTLGRAVTILGAAGGTGGRRPAPCAGARGDPGRAGPSRRGRRGCDRFAAGPRPRSPTVRRARQRRRSAPALSRRIARGYRPAATGSVVFDMVYEPSETPLLAAARAKGCRAIDGVEMLVAQAVGQFEAWAGAPAPVEAMTDAALAAIAEARA